MDIADDGLPDKSSASMSETEAFPWGDARDSTTLMFPFLSNDHDSLFPNASVFLIWTIPAVTWIELGEWDDDASLRDASLVENEKGDAFFPNMLTNGCLQSAHTYKNSLSRVEKNTIGSLQSNPRVTSLSEDYVILKVYLNQI